MTNSNGRTSANAIAATCAAALLCLVVGPPVAEIFAGEPSKYAFSLPGIDGETIELSRANAPEITVVVFVGTECPIARLYAPRLQRIADDLADRGVKMIGVGSNHQDSIEELRAFAKLHGLTFPICKDADNVVADRYGATRITEVVALDRSLAVLYRGRIDDQFEPGLARSSPQRDDLRQALEEAVAGRPLGVSATEPVGCLIGRKPKDVAATDVTYADDVAGILRNRCVECHRDGEIGPFALTDYDEIVGWGPTLMEAIDDGRMPPWHAEPGEIRFANERQMPESEKETLRRWVAGGMPLGDAGKLAASIVDGDTAAKPRPTPDLVVPMGDRLFHVPADQTVEYQYYVVDPGLEEDAWIAGAEVVPGNRSVVHHCIVFVRPPDGAAGPGIGWLSAYVPGQRSMPFPEGYARRVPAGSKLVFQMHYTPTGTPQEDLTRIELRFADEKSITHEVFTSAAIDSGFEIPPHASDWSVVTSRADLPADGMLLAVAPHMHVRGKSFALYAESGDDRRTLLNVPRYDFNWQHVYAFAEPIPLAGVDRLTADVRFDNSAGNPTNPDPTAFVYWGDQTDEEMAIGFFEIAVPRDRAKPKRKTDADESKASNAAADSAAETKFVDDYLARFDGDGDGRVIRDELPPAIRAFGFRDLDVNDDGALTRDEIARQFRRRNAR